MPSPAVRDLIWSSKTSANDGTTYTAFNISSDSLSDVESDLANPCGRQGETPRLQRICSCSLSPTGSVVRNTCHGRRPTSAWQVFDLQPSTVIAAAGKVSPLTYSFLAILGSGPGIIVLPIALYLLGWVAGLIAMLVVATITWYTSLLLAQTYGQGRLADGSRNYTDAVSHFLGELTTHEQPWHLMLYSVCGSYKYPPAAGRKYAFTYSLLRGVDDLGGTVPVTVVGGAVMGYAQ